MTTTWDCIVLGVGGFGSGTLYHLARRGARVLGIEQFTVAHDRGSSHGQTRIIRKAYFEHADYVPLLHRAYYLWRELEAETSQTLFHPVGLFIAGGGNSEAVEGTLHAAKVHQLPVDQLTPSEAATRFPVYRFPQEMRIVFEQDAGYLDVENCVTAHIDAAQRCGAVLKTGETVRAWQVSGDTVHVTTGSGRYSAARLIITAGPWSSRLLADLGLPLHVVRKPVCWFPATDPRFDASSRNPAFFFDLAGGQFYGFPRLDGCTIKVAEHTGGDLVGNPHQPDRNLHAADVSRLSQFLETHIPLAGRQPATHSICMYTKTPDGHFLIDRHPRYPHVLFGAGFSGHGFKFTTVLGEVLADLALDGRTAQPIGFLSAKRFDGTTPAGAQ